MNVDVFAPCFYPTAEAARPLMASAERVGIHPQLYGIGKEFQSYFHAKIEALRPLVEASTADLILYTDAADVVCTSPIEEMVETYVQLVPSQDRLLIGSERVLWPLRDADLRRVFLNAAKAEKLTAGFIYPGPGFVFGPRDHLLRAIDALALIHSEGQRRGPPEIALLYGDDMLSWLIGLVAGKVDAQIDYHCEMSLSLKKAMADEMRMNDGKLLHVATNSRPHMLHFNGSRRKCVRAFMERCFLEITGEHL